MKLVPDPPQPRRVIHTPPRTRPTTMDVHMDVHDATEIEVVRLEPTGSLTVIVRDQFTGAAVNVTYPYEQFLRMVQLGLAVIPTPATGSKASA